MGNKPPTIEDYCQGCLYFSLSRLQREINKLAEDAFSDTGIAPSHAFLLMALNENEVCNASDLSKLLGLAPSTITRFVDKLEKQGFCKRTIEGRISYVSITDKGRAMIPIIEKGWKTLFDRYNERYGQEAAADLNATIVGLNTAP